MDYPIAMIAMINEFNKYKYIESGLWFSDPYLINPDSISKKCACCKRIKFTIEFADFSLFVDGKVPVCVSCLRSRASSKQERVASILKNTFQKECIQCEREMDLYHFPYNIKTFGLNKTCRFCRDGEGKGEE